MPVDSKRIPAPENSKSYSLFGPPEASKPETKRPLSVLVNNRRKDGRKCDELRRIYLRHGVVTRAKGSAYMELGDTKVVCSVFDPREIPRKSDYSVNGELYCEFKYAPYACRARRGHQQDWREKEASLVMRRALESAVCRHEFPNFQVDVYALVLEDGGSALAAAITCAGIALADASVPMYDLVVGATAGVRGAVTLLDPTTEEEEYCDAAQQDATPSGNNGIVTAAYMATQQQMSEFTQAGSVDADCLKATVKVLVQACETLYPMSQQCIMKGVKENIKNKDKEAASDE